ncbi:hypothetical protein LVJ83_11060 [Uruburuella testudinis]|uniref:Uncharacterized protein n=1 Tax=Uruburuella testudinis TaxID=1282863 RepID=A0ABY4DR15_9NEIS|nr:hypothetical protein [Uruburuella testudinis]UOO81475.1 hypothetical protein LVJ83_11060 [Uruburuella testudinis]
MIKIFKKIRFIKSILMLIFFTVIIVFFKPSKESSYRPDAEMKLALIQDEITFILNNGTILSTLTQGRAGRWFIVSINLKYTSYESIKERLKLHNFIEIKPNIFCRDEESIEILIDSSHNENEGTLYWLYPDNNCTSDYK